MGSDQTEGEQKQAPKTAQIASGQRKGRTTTPIAVRPAIPQVIACSVIRNRVRLARGRSAAKVGTRVYRRSNTCLLGQ